ncbi:MAG: ATP-binding cassette domain-containing protein [Nitrospirales bacterium]
MASAVEFRDVTFQHASGRTVLSGVSFTVREGESFALIGRSGSGKTTILKLINRLLDPSGGDVLVDGKSTRQWDPIRLRRRIGYVLQDIGLFPHLSIAANIGIVPTLEGWEPSRIDTRVKDVLQMVGLEPGDFMNRYPHELSGGQRQRVGVARALAADPPLLLMDEPFGALDPITRAELQQELKRLLAALNKTMVIVTHDIPEACVLGSSIGLVQEGKLVERLPPAKFLQSSHPEVQAVIRSLTIQNVIHE